MTVRLTVDQVVDLIHRRIEPGAGISDLGKLEGALGAPFQTYGGDDLHPGVIRKAAKLLEALATAHPFVEGNKRTAWMSSQIFLQANGYTMGEVPNAEAAQLVLDLVNHHIDLEQVVEWMERNVVRIVDLT